MPLIDFLNGTSADATEAAALMSSPVVALTHDVSVSAAADAMLRTGFTTLPVVDADGCLIKLVTEDAIAKAHLVQSWANRSAPDGHAYIDERGSRVIDFAAPPVSVAPHASLAEVAETMLRAQLRAVPVVEHGRPIGIVTWRDILATITQGSGARTNTK